MSIKPILFNTEMIRRIHNGIKSETRRVLKPLCDAGVPFKANFFVSPYTGLIYWSDTENMLLIDGKPIQAPYIPGDILYVRETFRLNECPWETEKYIYKADGHPLDWNIHKWRSPYHMPREAARIFLRVIAVKVERLQKITIDGIKSEGSTTRYTQPGGCDCHWKTSNCKNEPCGNRDAYEWHTYADPFAKLIWDPTIKPKDRKLYGWCANPWVSVTEFEQITRREAVEHGF